MADDPPAESFDAFRKSFAYGARTDLNFKFLKELSTEEAARFIQELFRRVGEMLDDGQPESVIEHLRQGQSRVYGKPASKTAYDSGPFTPLYKPVAALRLALVTSSGHFIEGDDPRPFGVTDLTQADAITRIGDFLKSAPVLSVIPADTPEAQLRVRHPGYDIHGVQLDPNVAFPLTRLRELQAQGLIGEVAAEAYSFVGACLQSLLLKKSGPEWVERIKTQGVDAVLLVPV